MKKHEEERTRDTLFGRMLREKDEVAGDVTTKEVQERYGSGSPEVARGEPAPLNSMMTPWYEVKAILEAFNVDANSQAAWDRWVAVKPAFQEFHDKLRSLRTPPS